MNLRQNYKKEKWKAKIKGGKETTSNYYPVCQVIERTGKIQAQGEEVKLKLISRVNNLVGTCSLFPVGSGPFIEYRNNLPYREVV